MNKRPDFKLLILIAFSFFAFAGCRSGDSSREVAENFLSLYGSGDYYHAKSYGTAETVRVMDMMIGLNKMLADSEKVETKFELVSCEEEGDQATAMYRKSGSNEAPKPLMLVKESGKWEVSMNKESMNEPLITGEADSTAVGTK